MSVDPAGHPARPPLDGANVALGAVVTAVLVALLGAGPLALSTALTDDEGANIGGGMLATLGIILAVGLGSAFTARRCLRRAGRPQREGVGAGIAGLLLVIVGGGLLMVVFGGLPLAEVWIMLPLAVPALGAAFAGAALGAAGHRPPE